MRLPVLRYVGLGLLLALAWLGIKGAIDQWSEALSFGQRIQTISQLSYGLFALLTIIAVLTSNRLARIARIAWLVSITVAALLAPVVWGGAGWATGLAAGVAALLVGLGILWLLGPRDAQPAVLVIVSVITLTALRPLSAQRIAEYEIVPAPTAITIPSALLQIADSAKGRRTYWLVGGIVGGVITGFLGMELSACDADSNSTCMSKPLAFLIGAVPGFTIGAFLGDTIPKKDETEDDE